MAITPREFLNSSPRNPSRTVSFIPQPQGSLPTTMRRSGSTNNDVAMGSVEMNAMHADRDEVKEAEDTGMRALGYGGRPDDEPLPSLSLEVQGDVGTFEHAEGADFAEEALAFCSRVVREDRAKSIVKNCAQNLKAQARRKVTQLLVDEQTDERRKAIEQAVDASLSSNPDKWKRARRRRKDR